MTKNILFLCSSFMLLFLFGCNDEINKTKDDLKESKETVSVAKYDILNEIEKSIENETSKTKIDESLVSEEEEESEEEVVDSFYPELSNLKISLKSIKSGLKELDKDHIKILFDVTNDSISDIIIQVDNLSLNGEVINPNAHIMSSEISKSSKGIAELNLYSSLSNEYTLPNDVENLKSLLRIIDKSSFSIIGFIEVTN